MKKRLPIWLLSLLLCVGIGAITVPTPATNPGAAPDTELRGVWITNVASGVLFAPWGVQRAMHQLAQLHFNTIYPVVWNRGYTFYPSPIAEQITGRAQDPWLSSFHWGRDVLAEIVQQGKRQHLRVLPWFEYGFMAPARSELALRHPDWLTQRRDGSTTLEAIEEESLPETAQGSAPGGRLKRLLQRFSVGKRVWLNPLHPEVQAFILRLVDEVASSYAIAGIQLDDHFGFPVAFGYDPLTVQRYQAEHGGAKPPDDPHDAEWMRWRADQLSAFMARVYQTVKAANPNAIISLSPNPQRFSYQSYLQDWQVWVKQGWVEELVLQVYRSDPGSFAAELEQPPVQAVRQQIPVAIGIWTGSWQRPIAFRQIQQQVETARSRQFSGVSFFYWETLWSYFTPEAPRLRRTGFLKLFTPS